MGLPELKRELKALDKQAVADAFARVALKSLDVNEAKAQVDALEEEYPALSYMATVMKVHGERLGLNRQNTVALMTGVVNAALALKELIDTEELNAIPSSQES
jgi:hypothetical protein